MDTTKPTLKGKRILVTGGNGYLGSHLMETLIKLQADVYIIDKELGKNPKSYAVDITNKEELQLVIDKIQPQIIFHLAALLNRERSFEMHDTVMRVNYQGTMNLLFALKDIDYENFIFTSTSEVYGDNRAPFTEDLHPDPASSYSMSKLYAEVGIQTYSKTYNKNYTIFRLFNFVGRDMPQSFFIPQMLQALKSGKSFQMTKGEQKRDFLYIDDVINALLLGINNPPALKELFNVCSGQSLMLRELVEEFKMHLASSSYIDFGAIPYRENEIWDMTGSNEKISRLLRFKPKHNILIELLFQPQLN